MLDQYSSDFGFIDLEKLAIDYSDGVIEAGEDVNPTLMEYVKSKQLLLMNYPGKENYAEAYQQFYAGLLETE